ncbi:hypothetical protein AVEN_20333-1 [Araneus ventricosus]|uniref:Uncharacterized protein n=1 Tax=Araneus ventricosus TaxID=182803 RepID=A0A4Y2IPL4_ARAVE|nr:hypothetical protein AVEN_20333-1 [Araneus ventricosus]
MPPLTLKPKCNQHCGCWVAAWVEIDNTSCVPILTMKATIRHHHHSTIIPALFLALKIELHMEDKFFSNRTPTEGRPTDGSKINDQTAALSVSLQMKLPSLKPEGC